MGRRIHGCLCYGQAVQEPGSEDVAREPRADQETNLSDAVGDGDSGIETSEAVDTAADRRASQYESSRCLQDRTPV